MFCCLSCDYIGYIPEISVSILLTFCSRSANVLPLFFLRYSICSIKFVKTIWGLSIYKRGTDPKVSVHSEQFKSLQSVPLCSNRRTVLYSLYI
uniref:Uncharacterized protein n=1 Tax=Gadus morhua TaxID=8049 RepID=A0A8C5AXL9_GADMO